MDISFHQSQEEFLKKEYRLLIIDTPINRKENFQKRDKHLDIPFHHSISSKHDQMI